MFDNLKDLPQVNPKETWEFKSKSNIEKAIDAINEIQKKYNVTVTSRGGAYGASKLVIVDNATGEEVEI